MFIFSFAKAVQIIADEYIVDADIGITGDMVSTSIPFVKRGKLVHIRDFKNEIAISNSMKNRIVLVDKDTNKYYDVSIEVPDECQI